MPLTQPPPESYCHGCGSYHEPVQRDAMGWRPQAVTCRQCESRPGQFFAVDQWLDSDPCVALCYQCAEAQWHRCPRCARFYAMGPECAADHDTNFANEGHCYECCCQYQSDVYGEEDDDDEYSDEYNGEARVFSWDYRPRFRFHGEGRVFLGAEIEIEVNGGREYSNCAVVATRHLDSIGYLKQDGSISLGFEIVTHPMTHAYAVDAFPWGMLAELSNLGAYADIGVGIHVHVNRDGFDGAAHVYRWLKLIYRNELAVSAIARRSGVHWASFRDSDRRAIKSYAKGDKEAPRYAAVNVTNSETFEVRVFASSLKAQEVRAALDLVAASVEYTRQLTVREIVDGGWTWTNFISWAREQGDTYAALITESEARV